MEFKEANNMFVCMRKDTYKTGKGTVDHEVSIEKADLECIQFQDAWHYDSVWTLKQSMVWIMSVLK